VTVITFFD